MPRLTVTLNVDNVDPTRTDPVAVAEDALDDHYLSQVGTPATIVTAEWTNTADGQTEPDDKDPDPAQPDREVEAIAACIRILLPLDPAQSAGVARYIADRFTIGDLRN